MDIHLGRGLFETQPHSSWSPLKPYHVICGMEIFYLCVLILFIEERRIHVGGGIFETQWYLSLFIFKTISRYLLNKPIFNVCVC